MWGWLSTYSICCEQSCRQGRDEPCKFKKNQHRQDQSTHGSNDQHGHLTEVVQRDTFWLQDRPKSENHHSQAFYSFVFALVEMLE